MVNQILDKAGNKGTGNWATIASAELGVPNTLIASALFSRYISFHKHERVQLHQQFTKKSVSRLNLADDDLLKAYQFARIINHYQGFKLIHEASEKLNWNLNLSEIARIWTDGCIIRSSLMEELVSIFKETNAVLTHTIITKMIIDCKPSIKRVVADCVLSDVTTPALSEALQFFNGITTQNSSANIIQAQRDYFGAHTYQRIDDNSGKFYHTNWI